ncbi:restriction endonuclease subunit S [Pseudomonas syringae]|uniref:restriction endonuclease subunit S n=1 Tax=Pseudomonas TaxID=286 RepID=UPI0032047792
MSDHSNLAPRHQYQDFLQQLPPDWEQKEIRQIGTVVSGGTPSREVSSYWKGNIPWVTPGEISGRAEKLLFDTKERISTAGLSGSGANLLPANSLMVTTRATLGARAINAVPMTTNQGFKSIIFKSSGEESYYFHLFEKIKPELVRRASGTTFLEISGAEFGRIKVPDPLLPEKQLIAKIIDTLDTAIHATDAVIYKLKAVERGMLHDLLTRGIDACGELRPPHNEAPQLYKESPLGWIPKEWRNTHLGKVASLQRGHDIVETDLVLGPYPVISSSGLVGYHNSSTSRGPNVVVGRKGSIGTVHYLETDFWAHDTSLFVTNFFGNNEKFVFHLFNYLKLGQYGTKSGSPSLNRNDIHPLPVGLPKLDEQALIVRALASHDETMKRSELERDKLMKTKSALMEDLLTGRVRVTPLLEGANNP